MAFSQIILSLFFLAFIFITKLLVARNIEHKDFMDSIFEFPVSLFFLSTSLFFVYLISSDIEKNTALMWCIGFLTVAILAVFIWRKYQRLYASNPQTGWHFLFYLNLGMSLIAIFLSIYLLVSLSTAASQQKQPDKDQSITKHNVCIK